ncbi:ankyrin, partial [Ascobolus immersus RN42]
FKIMMDRISSQNPEMVALARETLQWLTFSRKTLTIEDLKNALAVESADTELNPEKVTDIRFIVQSCLGLIVIDETSTNVGLFHYSVQEFLFENRATYFPESKGLGELAIGERCLTFINFPPFCEDLMTSRRENGGEEKDYEVEKFVELTPFLRYAAGHWGYHIGSHEVNERIKSLLLEGPLFAHAFSSMQSSDKSLVPYRNAFKAFDVSHGRGEDHFPYNVAHIAAFFGSDSCLSVLLDHAPNPQEIFSSTDSLGMTPLAIAAREGQTAAVKFLVEKAHVDFNIKDNSGRTAIAHAAEMCHDEALGVLLASETANPDEPDNNGKTPTPLSYAIIFENTDLAKMLIESKKVDLNSMDNAGETLFSQAVEADSVDMVKLLMESGEIQDLNKDNAEDLPPLALAAREGFESMVRVLVENDQVDVNIKDSVFERTPLGWAALKGRAGVKVYRDIRDVRGRTPLCNAAIYGHASVVELLLTAVPDVDINSVDRNQRTPLSYCARRGHKAVVELLLKAGADPNIEDSYQKSPLSYAVDVKFDNWEVVNLMLALCGEKIHINTKDHVGRTPLSYAME